MAPPCAHAQAAARAKQAVSIFDVQLLAKIKKSGLTFPTMRDSHLQDYYSFLRFPSVSTDEQYREKVMECAQWLVRKLQTIGLETQLVPTAGHPVVWAKNKHQPGRRTVMIYGHYDVQPPDPLELWESPPFEPVLKNGYVFARGATDNKGQILSHILGVQEALEQNGDLPVNLHFVIEGEEEIGSGNLGKFLSDNREALQCDVAVVSDTGMVARGVPTLSYGLRGVTALEVKITGAKMDLHSGVFGGSVANPVTALARLLATLHDKDAHVAIEGFYDTVKPLEDWERKAWRELPVDGDKAILDETGAPALFGEAGYTTLERIWGRPTAEINGIGGGYQGMGTKTVIASHAMAKLTFRLVPDQEGDDILNLATRHLEKHLPSGVTMEITRGHSGPWYLTDPHSDVGQAAQRALREAFGKEPATIREGGSIPIVSQFRSILGVETLLLGLALPDCRAHSPNENFPLENMEGGIRLNKAVLAELAKK
jgi:acetylornithine deacetylase/succinyl-diaminopimelate desuccinylase-like protein